MTAPKPSWQKTTPHPERPPLSQSTEQSAGSDRIEVALALLAIAFALALLLRAVASS